VPYFLPRGGVHPRRWRLHTPPPWTPPLGRRRRAAPQRRGRQIAGSTALRSTPAAARGNLVHPRAVQAGHAAGVRPSNFCHPADQARAPAPLRNHPPAQRRLREAFWHLWISQCTSMHTRSSCLVAGFGIFGKDPSSLLTCKNVQSEGVVTMVVSAQSEVCLAEAAGVRRRP